VSQQGAPSTRNPRRFESGTIPIARPELHLRAVSASHVGLVRSANEDACAIADLDRRSTVPGATLTRLDVGASGVLLAVSDGMGGARDGAVASAISIDVLVQTLNEAAPGGDVVSVLEGAVREAHRAVWDASCRAGHEGHTRMGATMTAALIRGQRAALAQVGDSRAYLLRQGRLTQLTKDQSMVQALIDRGLMRPEDAETSPFRNILTQAMGHQEAVDVATSEIDLRDRDCLLLCSDGLTGELSDLEIRDAVLTSMRLDVAAARLVDLANARGGHDNVTIVLAGVGSPVA